MGQARLPVRKIREVLRLKADGFSDRQIAAAIGSARSTVQACVRRAAAAGLSWPLPSQLDEADLQALLYRRSVPLLATPRPDFAYLHRELRRRGVTRMLLWQEYKSAHPDGWQYSVFCDQYRRWLATQEVVLRQDHAPGEKLFVDYAGDTLPITDRHSGLIQHAQIFVAVLGYSNYSYVEASLTQRIDDWLGAQVRALTFFGGAPRAIVPDNLKSAVNKAHRYDPDVSRSYQEFAEHYDLAVLPARVRKPRDKAKVEAGVLIVERWILARLRHRTFFSLAELNAALAILVEHLNARPFKKMDGCRRSRFDAGERATLKPLPSRPYEFAAWRVAKVHPDYHIEVDRAYYSVPYRFVGAQVDVRLSAESVEIFHFGKRIAVHPRARERAQRSTRRVDRPDRHIAVLEHSVERLYAQSSAIGPATVELLKCHVAARKHPEEALRGAQGILRLADDFSAAHLEAACERALILKAYSYRAVRTLLQVPLAAPLPPVLDLPHENVRGAHYFSTMTTLEGDLC